MITALRKIENRGELQSAPSGVMEMCIDNPRSGFTDLFATHPSVEARCKAIVEFAGGHDPVPLQLEAPAEDGQIEGETAPQLADQSGDAEPPAQGPWGEPPTRRWGPWGRRS